MTMRMAGKLPKSVYLVLGIALLLLTFSSLACGAPAAPTATLTPTAPATDGPMPTAQPSTTDAPTATASPAAPVVSAGNLTFMVAGWGNERFTYNYSVGGGNNYARLLQGYLSATSADAELLPGIATRWEVSPDGETWTFDIREGIHFHDGRPITAKDVWWTFMHYWGKDESGSSVERATQSSAQALARTVDTITQPAPNQVSITFLPGSGNAAFISAFVSEAAANWYGVVPQRPKVFDDAQEATYDKDPISAGPMKLVNHRKGEVMSFERFEDFYYQPKHGLPEDRRVKFQSLDLRLVPEEATRVAAIRAGEADIAPVTLGSRQQVEAGGGRLVFGSEGLYMRIMLLGCYNEQYPCHDKRVRQALDYAIDKQLIQERLFGGPEVFQVRGWAHVTPHTLGYTPELDPWPQDAAKARQLMAEAGYPDGEGFGKLVVNTWVSTAMPYLPESAQLAADFWRKELGLDVEVKVGDEAALKAATLSTDLHGQILWRDNEASLDKASIWLPSYASPTHGARLHENPELFKLVQDALKEVEPARRLAVLQEISLRGRDESYELGIGYVNIPWAVGPKVLEWQPWPLSPYPSNFHGITLR